MILVYPLTHCRCSKDHTFVSLILVFVITGIRKYIVFRIPLNTVHRGSTWNMMYCFSSMNIWLCHKQANYVWAIIQINIFCLTTGAYKLTISMNKSSLAEAIKSPVWLKLIVRTGHLRNITFQICHKKLNTDYISKNKSWIQ